MRFKRRKHKLTLNRFDKMILKLKHLIGKVTGHEYCCCPSCFKNCQKCGYYEILEEDRELDYMTSIGYRPKRQIT